MYVDEFIFLPRLPLYMHIALRSHIAFSLRGKAECFGKGHRMYNNHRPYRKLSFRALKAVMHNQRLFPLLRNQCTVLKSLFHKSDSCRKCLFGGICFLHNVKAMHSALSLIEHDLNT